MVSLKSHYITTSVSLDYLQNKDFNVKNRIGYVSSNSETCILVKRILTCKWSESFAFCVTKSKGKTVWDLVNWPVLLFLTFWGLLLFTTILLGSGIML